MCPSSPGSASSSRQEVAGFACAVRGLAGTQQAAEERGIRYGGIDVVVNDEDAPGAMERTFCFGHQGALFLYSMNYTERRVESLAGTSSRVAAGSEMRTPSPGPSLP